MCCLQVMHRFVSCPKRLQIVRAPQGLTRRSCHPDFVSEHHLLLCCCVPFLHLLGRQCHTVCKISGKPLNDSHKLIGDTSLIRGGLCEVSHTQRHLRTEPKPGLGLLFGIGLFTAFLDAGLVGVCVGVLRRAWQQGRRKGTNHRHANPASPAQIELSFSLAVCLICFIR